MILCLFASKTSFKKILYAFLSQLPINHPPFPHCSSFSIAQWIKSSLNLSTFSGPSESAQGEFGFRENSFGPEKFQSSAQAKSQT